MKTKKIKIARRDEIASEIQQLEEDIDALRSEDAELKIQEEWIKENIGHFLKLHRTLMREGTGNERNIINKLIEGEILDDQENRRLKELCIQFLKVLL